MLFEHIVHIHQLSSKLMFQSNVGPPIVIKLVEQLENSGQLEETGVPQLNMLFHGMIKKSKK